MKNRLKNYKKSFLIIFLIITILSISIPNLVRAYYGSPTWNSNFSFGWGGPNNYFNYSNYQNYANPYMYGPAMGIYYPYDTMFNVYNGAYTMNAGYNQNFMGFYNTGNFSGTGQQDINTIGYPLPYGVIDQRAWNTQMNSTSGIWGLPLVTQNYMSVGNPMNIYYDPMAFTYDLGLEASWRGIMNFWTGLLENLNDNDEDNE